MTPEQLKMSILQRAMEGKLVPQDPKDEPASGLLKRIKKEKEKLIKEGAIKRNKNETEIFRGDDGFHYEKFSDGRIEKVEVPHDIPESWEWVRLGSVCNLISGRDLKRNQYIDGQEIGIPYLTGASNFLEGGLSTDRYTEQASVTSNLGDLLITVKGTIGEMAFNSYQVAHIARQIMAINSNFINLKFIQLVISSYMSVIKSQAQSMIPGISRETLLKLFVPLPPQDEQIRIIDRVNLLHKKIKVYEDNYNQLKKLNAKFPSILRQSILQYAMQGKLVRQNPNDDSVEELLDQIREEKQKLYKEGKIKKKDLEENIIYQGDDNSYYENKKGKEAEADIDFNRPQNWLLQKVSDIFISHPIKSNQIKKSEIKESGAVPVITQGSKFLEGYSDQYTKIFNVSKPILIFGDHTKNIKYIDFDFIVGADGVKILEPIFLYTKFAEYSLLATLAYLKNRGYARHFSYLKDKIIGIPSKSMQKQIIQKIEKFFQILSQLD